MYIGDYSFAKCSTLQNTLCRMINFVMEMLLGDVIDLNCKATSQPAAVNMNGTHKNEGTVI